MSHNTRCLTPKWYSGAVSFERLYTLFQPTGNFNDPYKPRLRNRNAHGKIDANVPKRQRDRTDIQRSKIHSRDDQFDLVTDYTPHEIVLIDDGSSDKTQQVVENFHPKVKYHRITNSGICYARNVGATFASSPYLAFCDHDDLWRPDKLEKQMSLHNSFPEMNYSFTNFAIVSDGRWSLESKFDGAPKNFFEEFIRLDDAC